MIGSSSGMLTVLAFAGCGRIGFEAASQVTQGCEVTVTPATGTEYFVGPAGSDLADGTTPMAAWATFDRAWTAIQPGDTLTILDGVYTQALRLTISGAPGLPILIRAQHDGSVMIDGEDAREACTLAGTTSQHVHDVTLEGVHCTNARDTAAGGESPVLVEYTDRVRVHRVTGRGVHDGVFGINQSNDVVLEDVAAYGGSARMFTVSGSTGVVVRRCYGRWSVAATGSAGYAAILVVQASSGALVENCVGVAVPDGTTDLGGYVLDTQADPASDDRFVADIARSLSNGFTSTWSGAGGNVRASGTMLLDSAAIAVDHGAYQRADAALVGDRLTLTGKEWAFGVDPNGGAVPPATIGFTLESSVLSNATVGISQASDPLITLADHHDNVFDDVGSMYSGAATAGVNEQAFQPDWDLATYGDGGYLIRPSLLAHAGVGGGPAGAEILYRTVDGVLTTTPLWPWPLEDRILAEDGVSVTWESAGGLWRAPPPVSCR